MTDAVSSAHALTLSDLNTNIDPDEPRISSIRLAEALGFKDPLDVVELYERHHAEIDAWGVSPQSTEKPPRGSKGGRPRKIVWFSEPQALNLAVLSGAPNAPFVRRTLIEVFMAQRRASAPSAASDPELSGIMRDYAALPPRGMTAEQRTELTRVAASLGARAAAWGRATMVEEVSRRVAAGTGYQRALAQVHAEMFVVMTSYPPNGDGLDTLRAVFREVDAAPSAPAVDARRGRR